MGEDDMSVKKFFADVKVGVTQLCVLASDYDDLQAQVARDKYLCGLLVDWYVRENDGEDHAKPAEPILRDLIKITEERKAQVASLRAQLPAEMQDCTILFKKCERGHGRLTAANWIDQGCHWCQIRSLRDEGERERLDLECRLQSAHLRIEEHVRQTFLLRAALKRYGEHKNSCPLSPAARFLRR
jgi:hypothetical protein